MYNWNDIRHNGGHYDVTGRHQMKVLGYGAVDHDGNPCKTLKYVCAQTEFRIWVEFVIGQFIQTVTFFFDWNVLVSTDCPLCR